MHIKNSTKEDASPTLKKFASMIASKASGPVLDAPSGYGRNALLMKSLGCTVVCADIDNAALEFLRKNEEGNTEAGQIIPTVLDLKEKPWCFPPNSFGAILNIHFVMPELFQHFEESLIPGGLLYIETYENRGGNFFKLPKLGEFRKQLSSSFRMIFYDEKKAGPDTIDACTVRLLAQKCNTA